MQDVGEEGGEIGMAEPSAPPLTAELLGKSFSYQETFSNSMDVVDWLVTVDGLPPEVWTP